MGNFAIKGHPTRGNDVIALLEMLGGVNKLCLSACNKHFEYSIIKHSGVIQSVANSYDDKIFTLEEFEEKFPYKVGDNVMIDQYACTILSCWWDESVDEVAYCVKGVKGVNSQVTTYVKDLKPYKEQETMEEKTYPPYMDYDVKTINTMKKEILPYFLTVYDSEENKHEIVATDGYEIKEENGKFYAVKKKPQYPKTYDECCSVLVGREPKAYEISFSKMSLQLVDDNHTNNIAFDAPMINEINILYRLIMCRNAYWKIVGVEMGLDKPWEPDWTKSDYKFCIINMKNKIVYDDSSYISKLLAFPTPEIRDDFYKAFENEIEVCKKFL